MRPIRDIDELAAGAVLYHSAFGFAEVRAIEGDEAKLLWRAEDENLPSAVTIASLRKAWSVCRPDGFFARALLQPDTLSEQIHVEPTAALTALLNDLGEAQERLAIREWVTGTRLLTAEGFDRWWSAALPLIRSDHALTLEGETLLLGSSPDDAESTLARTTSAADRLTLAIERREELSDDSFEQALFSSWVEGNRGVRDRALEAAAGRDGTQVFEGLIDAPGDATEALIHAIRHGDWTAADLGPGTHTALAAHLLARAAQDLPLDAEGRLAAALTRWGSPSVVDGLATCTGTAAGQRLIRSTLAALTELHAAELAAELFLRALNRGDETGCTWLAEILYDGLDLHPDTQREVFAARGAGFTNQLASYYRPPAAEEEEGMTAELDLSSFLTEAVPLSQLPPQSGLAFVAVGLAMARGLAAAHNADTVVTPSRDTVWLLPDGGVEFRGGGERGARRPQGEGPGKAGDVYSSAVLLIEAVIGRPWPSNVNPALAIPYLRGAVVDLPPSAMAPLDQALHPDPNRRPSDGLAWLVSWQAAAQAEDERLGTTLDLDSRLDVGYDSHVGRMKILYTQTNQDALFVAERSGVTLLVVCDGISTATAGSGDVAAGITAHVVSSLWEQALARLRDASVPETEDFLARAFRMANQAVCEAALRFAGGRLHGRVPMGTTAVVGISRGNRLTLAWLGDSRAYLVGPYGASLLTADMNQAGDRLVGWVRGDLPNWDANGYALVGYVGHFDEAFTAIPLQPAVVDLHLLPGERIVICSDGVTDYASPNHPETANRIARAVLDRPCDIAARALIELANQGGGGDNATAVVATLRDS